MDKTNDNSEALLRADEPDMSWIDIAVCKRGAVVHDYAPGWDDHLVEHFAEDNGLKVPALPVGLYRWSGYRMGAWSEDEAVDISGGVFTPYVLTRPSSPAASDGDAVERAERIEFLRSACYCHNLLQFATCSACEAREYLSAMPLPSPVSDGGAVREVDAQDTEINDAGR